MRSGLLVGIFLIVMIIVIGGTIYLTKYPLVQNSSSNPACSDPSSINTHVYHPSRLQVVKDCVKASGKVELVRQEADGDLHVRLALDPANSSMTNSANDQYQHGDLVAEIICVGPVTQSDAVSSCQNYNNPVQVPSLGQHVTVTGPYVLDTEHYGWAEIHPVYSLTADSSDPEPMINVTDTTLSISYPAGSTWGWLGPTPRSIGGLASLTPGDQFTTELDLYSTSSTIEQITSITLTTPGFSLLVASPNIPIIFNPYDDLTITVTIQCPSTVYDGPINIQVVAR